MVQISAVIFAAALVAPGLVASLPVQAETTDHSLTAPHPIIREEPIRGRPSTRNGGTGRAHHGGRRELSEAEEFAREEPIRGRPSTRNGGTSKAHHGGRRDLSEAEEFAREEPIRGRPSTRNGGNGRAHHGGRRELEDDLEIEARDPKFRLGKIFKGAAKMILRDDEVVAREEPIRGRPSTRNGGTGRAHHGGRRELSEVEEFAREEPPCAKRPRRELEDAEEYAREEPTCGKPTRKNGGKRKGHVRRELSEAEEFAREEPIRGRPSTRNGGNGRAHHGGRRELEDDLEIEARDPKFRLGKIFKGAAKMILRDDSDEMLVRETPEFDELD